MSESQLQIHQPAPMNTTGDFIAAALASGVNESSVAVVERLCALRERETEAQAKREFSSSFAQLQADMPQIVAYKAVPGNDGSVRYKYAPYEEIMTKARPSLGRHGFAVTFDTEINDGRVIVTCTLIHASGHSRSNKFACRIGKGPPASSEAQGDGAATTYAKRFALCAALNIVIESDTDARNDGDDEVITQAQADELREMCDEAEASRVKFLEFARAKEFEQIRKDDFERVREVLVNKVKAKK